MGPTRHCRTSSSGTTCRARCRAGCPRRGCTCRSRTCSRSAVTTDSIRHSRPRTYPAPPATFVISIEASTADRIRAAERSPLASTPRSSDRLHPQIGETMKITSRHPLAFGAASLMVATAALWSCKNFLTDAATPQGTLSQATLETKSGVEGTLIGAYRALDCTSDLSANWGCAASDWVWGSVASDDSYKGSDASDQPPINDIEAYHWGAPAAQDYLNVKWQISYEGVVRANSTLRLLAAVQKSNPGAISAADAQGIAGE